jgi:hypothetical protein
MIESKVTVKDCPELITGTESVAVYPNSGISANIANLTDEGVRPIFVTVTEGLMIFSEVPGRKVVSLSMLLTDVIAMSKFLLFPVITLSIYRLLPKPLYVMNCRITLLRTDAESVSENRCTE